MLNPISLAQGEPAAEDSLVFSHSRGFYRENFILTLSSATPGAEIRYTLDGTDPSKSVKAFKGVSPLQVSIDPADTTNHDLAPGVPVRAVLMRNNVAISAVKAHTFLFLERAAELSPDGKRPGPGWPTQWMSGDQQWINYGLDAGVYRSALYRDKFVPALLDIPTISVAMDLKDLFNAQRGIYVNAGQHGIGWERPCSMELLDPQGGDGFQINAGIRIRGGYSRSNQNPKHAFRFFFRQQYGKGKLEYPLFGDEGVDEFDSIDLRTSQNYSWSFDGSDLNTMNRDVFSRDSQRDLGQPYTRSRYYHLYINGTYWGLFQTQERSEASFAAGYWGGNGEDYDVIKVAADMGYVIEATDGTLDAWRRLWETARDGFLNDSSYYYVQGCSANGVRDPQLPVLLDIDNLIDYLLVTYIAGNYDAPVSSFLGNTSPNNFYALCRRGGDQGFLFFQHDAEHTMRNDPNGVDRTGPYPAGSTFDKSNPQWLHQRLMEHPHYRSRFADHVNRHFLKDGALTPTANIKRFLDRKEEIDLAIIAESARWGDSRREPAFTRDKEWLTAINWIVDSFFPTRTQVVLNQLKNKGWFPITSAPQVNLPPGRVAKGSILQLYSPVGKIYYCVDGSDPFVPSVSQTSMKTLIAESAEKYVTVPSAFIDFNWRRLGNYDLSSWIRGTGAAGYERSSGYESQIRIDVGAQMYNLQTSCYMRIPFTVNLAELKKDNLILLKVKYDDGFIAYLNGWKVAESLSPSPIEWNSAATANHESSDWELFSLSANANRFVDDENFLALHALNVSAGSSDFIISAELSSGKITNSGKLSPSAIEYVQPLTLASSTRVKARTVLAEDWSALIAADYYVIEGLDNLRITEIHYHPLASDTTDDGEEYEFIEMKNIGETPLLLDGVSVSSGVDYSFPAATELAPGQFIVIAANSDAFESRYHFRPHGQYQGKLNNSGEILALSDAAGDTLIRISYDDQYPWPNSADGTGYSLVTRHIDPYMDQDDPRKWTASSIVGGTPGSDDGIAAAVEESESHDVLDFALEANYPNPFNNRTTITFDLPRPGRARLRIFNLLGQQVDVLLDQQMDSGRHRVQWDAAHMAAGVYFYRLESDDGSLIRKLTLLK